jgi:2-succinyl-6-hydroxy-2,4-cyclohexadiene-1-carboxylate synthase
MATPLCYNLIGTDKTKPVLLFLHGFLGDRTEWVDLAESFSDDYRCLLVDLPGHGENRSLDENDYTIQNCAQALLQLLVELEIDKADLLGYSMGGRLALYLAVTFPKRCRRVILESSSPGLKTKSERDERAGNDRELATKLEREGLDVFLNEWYDKPIFATLKEHPGKLSGLLKQRRRSDPAGLAMSLRLMSTGRQPSLWDKLSKINLPLLLLAGEKDLKFSGIAHSMADLCPTAEVRIIANAGHNLHIEQPEQFVRIARDFLAGR